MQLLPFNTIRTTMLNIQFLNNNCFHYGTMRHKELTFGHTRDPVMSPRSPIYKLNSYLRGLIKNTIKFKLSDRRIVMKQKLIQII